jgi:predicted  nucleic acid-binding Zn-ribbon protein
MMGDAHQMRAEIIELQIRVAELSSALEIVREERDNAVDAARSLHIELEMSKSQGKSLQAVIDRLRLHIQQGVEL